MQPYRCLDCHDIFYAEAGAVEPHHGTHTVSTSAGEDGYVRLNVLYCAGRGVFAGFSEEELDKMGKRLDSRRYESLNEEHNWERMGQLNPHTLPLRDTPNWGAYVAAGRIQKDEKGRDCLYSKNKKEWADSMTDLGYGTDDGAGTVDTGRQQGVHRE